jgi:hypothetical protein
VSADIARTLQRQPKTKEVAEPAHVLRARIVLALGPATAVAGIVWALAQPWRLTVLHPAGQGFWWLVAEPPLYVVLVGVLFRLLLAPGIVADLEEAGDGSARDTSARRGPTRQEAGLDAPSRRSRPFHEPEGGAG